MTQTTKDAEALAQKLRNEIAELFRPDDYLDSKWQPVFLAADDLIKATLTAAEQRGFERGKADVVRTDHTKALTQYIFDVTARSKKYPWQETEKHLQAVFDVRDAKARAEVERNAAAALPAPLTERAQQWQPIDTAPKDGTPIIAFFPQAMWEDTLRPSCLVIIWETWDNWKIYQASEGGDLGDWVPTHWMPLPAARRPVTRQQAGGRVKTLTCNLPLPPDNWFYARMARAGASVWMVRLEMADRSCAMPNDMVVTQMTAWTIEDAAKEAIQAIYQ